MRKTYPGYVTLISASLLIIFTASCKKENKTPTPVTPVAAPLATVPLYEADSGIYKRIFIEVTKVGTQAVDYFPVFDTGSAGMAIDANGILPAAMITKSGISVTGDSTVVNGITVTSQTGTVAFGNAQDEIKEYGNLAYTTIKIGDQNGNITTTRIPIFLYYKVMDITTGEMFAAHSQDVFGVGPGNSAANFAIASPLSYFSPPNGGISGFKLATLNNSSFSLNGTEVNGLLTIGLIPGDISSSSSFIMHPLTYEPPSSGGYSPDIPATITYNGTNVAATVLFDTGTPAFNIISNSAATANTTTLPANTQVTITTNNGFSYQYVTASDNNITDVARPSYTGDPRTIFGIDFFLSNEFLLNYRDHIIGLKNN